MTSLIVGNPSLSKLQSFFNDALYQELTQNSARFNVGIRKDRSYRHPYIDGQTGIAQKHCNLFVSDKQRMPGILQGQVYTYPAKRWKSAHRSYLASFMQAPKPDVEEHTITTVENPAALMAPVVPEESSISLIDKPQKEPWVYYEENAFEEDIEEDFDSEEDYDDETYSRKGGKRKKLPNKKPRGQPMKPKKKVVLKAPARLLRSIKKDENDTENKPYVCELCGMRYKTRPGLTYHYAHSHREEEDEPQPTPKPNPPPMKYPPSGEHLQNNDAQVFAGVSHPPVSTHNNSWAESNGVQNARPNRRPSTTTPPTESSVPPPSTLSAVTTNNTVDVISLPASDNPEPVKKVPPSPYCDFCLGDSSINKKTGQAENLVSCADCGRSGHPSCLQFTENMIKSVLKYRWQCIECKTCTLCGTSENDDQLLFCDDCDRGYHLYCLSPPLSEPPEGEWSCSLCIKEFHNK